MRILITGSSGQIGTNLALRLKRDGHDVFGVDKRPNPWVSAETFPTLLQDLAGHYSSFRGGVNGVEYPDVDLVVHLAAHAKVHQLVRQPHRALENAIMTFNVLEYARELNLPIIFSSSREVYGDVHRFEEYAETVADFAFTESTYSASKIAGEAFIYSYARCYGLRYLVFRFSNVYGRYDNDLQRMVRVLPLWIHKLSRGEAITVDPPISDMGDVPALDTRSIPIRLVNHTDHPVRVYGGTADCSCVVWNDLPVVVPPRGGQSVTIRVAFRGSPRAVRHSFVLFTDDTAQSQVFGEVRGRVVSKGGS